MFWHFIFCYWLFMFYSHVYMDSLLIFHFGLYVSWLDILGVFFGCLNMYFTLMSIFQGWTFFSKRDQNSEIRHKIYLFGGHIEFLFLVQFWCVNFLLNILSWELSVVRQLISFISCGCWDSQLTSILLYQCVCNLVW